MNKGFKSNLKLRSLLMSLLLVILLSNSGFAAKGVDVYLHNQKLDMPVTGTVDEGRTLVPMRSIFESLEAEVEWLEDTKTVVATKDDRTLKLPIGSNIAYVDNQPVTLELEPIIKDGNTLVPVRFITETFGFETKWDGPSRSVLLNSDSPFKNVTVQEVISGNQIKANVDGKVETIKLIGVDTYNLKHDKERASSKNYLSKLIKGKEVGIELDNIVKSGNGELLGYLHHNGDLVNEAVIRKGYAKSGPSGINTKYKTTLDKAESKAKAEKLGTWKPIPKPKPKPTGKKPTGKKPTGKKPITNNVAEVYITRTGGKYHRGSCRYLRKSKIPISKKSARSRGYDPCKVCRP